MKVTQVHRKRSPAPAPRAARKCPNPNFHKEFVLKNLRKESFCNKIEVHQSSSGVVVTSKSPSLNTMNHPLKWLWLGRTTSKFPKQFPLQSYPSRRACEISGHWSCESPSLQPYQVAPRIAHLVNITRPTTMNGRHKFKGES